MQSVSRAIKRGNAIMVFDNVHKRFEVVMKKGTELKKWEWSLRNQIPYTLEHQPIVNDDKTINRRRKRNIN